MDAESAQQKFSSDLSELEDRLWESARGLRDVLSQAEDLKSIEASLKSHGIDSTPSGEIDVLVRRVKKELLVVLEPFEAAAVRAPKTRGEEAASSELSSLKQQIVAMKSSRDKLLFEMDRLSVELESSEAQRRVLEKQRSEQTKLAAYWRQRSEDCAAQVDRLKNLLEDGAEVCLERGQTAHAERLSEAAQRVEERQQTKTLISKLVSSEANNSGLRDAWLPTLRELESRLMELHASAKDIMD